MTEKNRLVLAYSGGLDTSVAIPYLKDRTGKDVVAVSLDVGQGGEALETIKQRALACGAVESYIVDARDELLLRQMQCIREFIRLCRLYLVR